MKILFVVFPTFGGDQGLHLSSKGLLVVATDELIRLAAAWPATTVEVLNLGPPTDVRLFCSGIVPKSPHELNSRDVDVLWYMLRDPTQPPVLEMLSKLRLDQTAARVINDPLTLAEHTKFKYLPILARHGVGPDLVDGRQIPATVWEGKPDYAVSQDRRYIRTCALNNNRTDYGRGNPLAVARYLDSAAGGIRSFFRIGYALEELVDGWLYASQDNIVIQKTGACKHRVPFSMPQRFQPALLAALREIGCDVAHLEGTFFQGRPYIFDVNPYPTSEGLTLGAISKGIVDTVMRKLEAR